MPIDSGIISIPCESIKFMYNNSFEYPFFKEWDDDKNAEINPTDVTISSGKMVWWRCINGHSWKASIANRNKGTGCPYCSGNIAIKGRTDLATLRKDLLAEWDYKENNALGITPENVSLKHCICSEKHKKIKEVRT